MPHHNPTWHHDKKGLAVKLGHRADLVPAVIGAELVGPAGIGTSADAAQDLLTLEGRLQQASAALVDKVDQGERAIAQARDIVAASRGRWSLRVRRQRRQATTVLNKALGEQFEAVSLLEHAYAMQDVLRQFVIDLDVPTGLLAEAAAGWQRSPDVPISVVVFDDEEHFLTVDPRREHDTGFGYSTVRGDEFGHAWRRDGDADDPVDRTGPWLVGYIPRTQEIYASRRSGYLPQQVWLLGNGFDVGRAHELLTGLEPRMREPNSLILVAECVHAARPLDASGELHCPPPRRADDERPHDGAVDSGEQGEGTELMHLDTSGAEVVEDKAGRT